MRLIPLGPMACATPADAARATGCDTLTPLHFPGGTGSTVLEGTVQPGTRPCWTLRLEAGRRLDLRLTNTAGEATVEVHSHASHGVRTPGGAGSFTSSTVSSSTVSSSTVVGSTVVGSTVGSSTIRRSSGGGHTRLSIGPQSPGGVFLIAIGALSGAPASYRLEVTLR